MTRAWPPVRFGALLAPLVALALPVCALLAGPARGAVTLRGGQSAYMAVWDPAIWTLRPNGACRREVTLRFRLPPAIGMLSARPPARLAVCPVGSLSLSETFSAGVFSTFSKQLDRTGAATR